MSRKGNGVSDRQVMKLAEQLNQVESLLEAVESTVEDLSEFLPILRRRLVRLRDHQVDVLGDRGEIEAQAGKGAGD